MHDKWGTPASGSFTIEEVEGLADSRDWNPRFDRRDIHKIELHMHNDIRGVIHAS